MGLATEIFAVLVHLRGKQMAAAFRRLLELGMPPGQIVAVDNGSWDGSGAILREEFPQLSWVILPENRGFAGGANAGLARALDRGASHLLLLNDDLLIEPGCLELLATCMSESPRLAAVAPQVLRPDGQPEPWTGRLSFGPLVLATRGRPAANPTWLLGTCLLIRSEAWREVGPFDDRYFAYFEDVDWCIRARRCGWLLRHLPQARAVHAGAASTGGDEYVGAKRYLMARNAVRFVRQHASGMQKLRFALSLLAWLPAALVFRSLRGETAGLQLKLRGYWDGLLDRPLPLAALDLRPPT